MTHRLDSRHGTSGADTAGRHRSPDACSSQRCRDRSSATERSLRLQALGHQPSLKNQDRRAEAACRAKRDLLRDEVQKTPTSVMIVCSTKIKVSGRLSGKTCSRGPIPSLRVLARARVFPGQCGLPAAISWLVSPGRTALGRPSSCPLLVPSTCNTVSHDPSHSPAVSDGQ